MTEIAIGWCNSNDRLSYYRVGEFDIDDAPEDCAPSDCPNKGFIKSVVCFEIAPEYRGQEVAGKHSLDQINQQFHFLIGSRNLDKLYLKIHWRKAIMRVELKPIDETNREDCIKLKVTEAQSEFIASNESSLEAALEHVDVARPFAIYADGQVVGFAMLVFDVAYEDPNDRYWLWRFMIDKNQQGRGIGKEALKQIITYFKENGATNIRLSSKSGNVKAISLYKSIGFRETGKESNGEELFELNW